MNLGGPEMLILLFVAVLVFGAGWLPKAARNLGKAKVEFDKTTKQLNETKEQFVEASGVKNLDATLKKANKALNTSPQNLLKGAAASAVKPAAKPAGDSDEDVEDAEIVTPAQNDSKPDAPTTVDTLSSDSLIEDANINVDFSD